MILLNLFVLGFVLGFTLAPKSPANERAIEIKEAVLKALEKKKKPIFIDETDEQIDERIDGIFGFEHEALDEESI